jgi:uncharacterized caspase-like protein
MRFKRIPKIIFITSFFLLLLLEPILSSSRGISRVSIKTQGGDEVGLYEESHALVIGVSDYQKGWPRLNGVKEDVREVRKALEENGFKVKLVMDPERSVMEREIREFVVRHGRKEDNRLLFYYAGHGYSQKKGYGGQMGYLVPRDAPSPNQDPVGFELSAISMQNIETYARDISSKHALFVFDSCFAGSIFNVTRAIPRAIEIKTAKPVRQFITSGSADQEVPDMSVFRIEFVRALKGEGDLNKDGYLTASELGQHLEAKVVEYRGNQQTPQYGKLNDPILSQGDFVFKVSKDEIKKKRKKSPPKLVVQPKASIRADEEAWELVKDSSDPEDLQFFLESFPESGLSKVARLKLRMMKKKRKKTVEEPKTAEIKPKKKRNEYWENTSFKQEWFRSDQDKKRGLLGSMAACNRLFYSGHGWRLPSRSDVFRSFDELLSQGLIGGGESIWTMDRHGNSQAWFYELPKNLSDLNIDDAKNPKKGNKDFERSYLCIRSDDFDFQKMRTEYNRLLSNKSLLAHKAFIKNYSDENRAKNEVAAIRKRIRNLKEKKKSLITWKNHVTGLLWQRKDNPVIKTFPQAVGYCAGMLYDSKRGWRLPSPKEWQDASKIKEFRDLIKGKGYWTSEKTGFDTAKYFSGNQKTTFSGFVNLNQSVLCVHGNDSVADEMNTEFNRLKSNPSKLAHRAFIKKYEKRPGAESKVNLIRQRLKALSGNSREDYERVVRESEDTLGCFLFGCDDPLRLPTYKSDFHIVQYKRIKVYASRRPWLSTGIRVDQKSRYTLYMVGSGETRGCNRPACKTEPLTKNRLVIKPGEDNIYEYPRFSSMDGSSEIKYFNNLGKLYISYKDWRTWPPPQGWYQDNSGHILIDAFLYEKDKKDDFKRFLRAVKRLNPDDENMKKINP